MLVKNYETPVACIVSQHIENFFMKISPWEYEYDPYAQCVARLVYHAWNLDI